MMSVTKSSIGYLVGLGVLLVPAKAHACSMCMLADPKTAGTYLGMTVMMSILPLSMLGGLVYWLWRRYSAPEPQDANRFRTGEVRDLHDRPSASSL